jgi:hypothetical protein
MVYESWISYLHSILIHETFRILTHMHDYTTVGPIVKINWTLLIELNVGHSYCVTGAS